MLSFRLAFRSLLRNWRHSLASLLSIALGFVAVGSLQGYYSDSLDQFANAFINRTMTGHIVIDKREGENPLLAAPEIKHIERTLLDLGQEFSRRVRFLRVEGIIAGTGSSFAFGGLGYDVLEGEIVRGKKWAWNSLYGVPLDRKGQSQIVVGVGLAELLGCQLSGLSPVFNDDGTIARNLNELECFNSSYQLTALTEAGKMNASDAMIKGVVDAGVRDLEDSWVMMPLEEAQTLLNTESLSMIGVHIRDESRVDIIRDQIRGALKEFPSVVVDKWQDHPMAEIYRAMKDVMMNMQIFMLTVVVVVSVLSMVNTMIRSIDDRQEEIGTLRALGYRNRFVLKLFAWEGAFLGLFGSLLGVLGVVLVSGIVDSARILYYPAVLSQRVPLRIGVLFDFYAWLGLGLIVGSGLVAMAVAWLKVNRDIVGLLRD